jgi:amino acid transporter
LTGLWHGAGWNYVLWGVYFFLILTVEKECMPTLECLPDSVCRCITLWLVLVGWIIFSHDSITDFQAAFLATLGYGGMAVEGLWALLFGSIPLLAICFLGCSKFPVYVKRIFDGICDMGSQRKNPSRATPLRMVHLAISLAVMCLLLWLCTVSMVSMPTLPSIFANL